MQLVFFPGFVSEVAVVVKDPLEAMQESVLKLTLVDIASLNLPHQTVGKTILAELADVLAVQFTFLELFVCIIELISPNRHILRDKVLAQSSLFVPRSNGERIGILKPTT